jgi:hypothetical protein
MPILRITKEGLVLQEIEIQAEMITIGREMGNDVRLGDLTVSRRHARLRRKTGGRYYIEDRNSSNGVRLNGYKITQPVALTDGDQLRVGAYQIVFLDPVEVKKFRQTHLSTTTGKLSRSVLGKTPPPSKSRPEPGHNHGGSAQDDHPLEIGVLVNEANNAIFAIDRGQAVLGSDPEVDIRVPGPARTRATIARRGDYFYICSETPTPCVSVNGRPVMNSRLVFNDRIEIGGRRFIFREI